MLDQIVGANAVLPNIRHNLSHHIILMVPGENHLFLSDHLGYAVFNDFLLFFDIGNESMDQIHQAVTLKNFLPQIAGNIPIGIMRITSTTGHTGTIGTRVEGQETGIVVCKLCGHPCFIKVNCEVDQETMIQSECKFLGAAVVLELVDGTDIVLTCQLVLQFQGNHRNAVDRQHHINGVGIGGAVSELSGTAKDIGIIQFGSQGVQIRLRLEEADFQLATHVLNAVA